MRFYSSLSETGWSRGITLAIWVAEIIADTARAPVVHFFSYYFAPFVVWDRYTASVQPVAACVTFNHIRLIGSGDICAEGAGINVGLCFCIV